MHKTNPNYWRTDYGTTLVIDANGVPCFPGVDYEGRSLSVHFETNKASDFWNFIVIKISGGGCWGGRGQTREYAGGEFIVFRIHAASVKNKERILTVERIVEVPITSAADLQKRRTNKAAKEAEKYAELRKAFSKVKL